MMVTMFDEYQGLTADMVRNYLAATGWHLKDWDYYKDWHLADCAGPPCIAIYDSSSDGMHQLNPEHALLAISKQERRTPQGLLREINPRMRRGMPSKAAMEAHGETKDWLCMGYVLHVVRFCWSVNDHVQMVDGMDVFSTESTEVVAMIERCTFWPCDANGNKVRWPEKDGVML